MYPASCVDEGPRTEGGGDIQLNSVVLICFDYGLGIKPLARIYNGDIGFILLQSFKIRLCCLTSFRSFAVNIFQRFINLLILFPDIGFRLLLLRSNMCSFR